MILLGDCRDVMATLDAGSIDSIVSDPPYGLSFMGKGWDHGAPGVDFWTHALRVAKPGAHLLAFGGTRTYHRLACAIEDAGWDIRDCVMWVYGSGFPKSHDVSKAIDKAAGAEREIIGSWKPTGNARPSKTPGRARVVSIAAVPHEFIDCELPITAPATEDAKRWNGWGTALKPAWEPVIVARKPLDGTVAENVIAHGTGAMNVGGCRVEGNRWPANLIHDGSDEVLELFPTTASNSAARFFYCAKASKSDRDEGCDELPSKQMGLYAQDEWSRQHMGSTPDARREARHNTHPTVKPTALMRYLCRLVTPPGGLVLDPFAGSGSTGKAAILEGFRFVGIEQDETYAAIARARIDDAMKSRGEA